MDIFNSLYISLVESLNILPPTIAILLVACALLFIIQLYLRIFVWRVKKPKPLAVSLETPSISVVVVLHEYDQSYIETTLIDILNQDYNPFEVVVVDCSYDEFINERLQIIQQQFSHLRITTIRKGSGFDNCEKLALNIGFKAAIYDNLLLTTSKCYPTSNKWIASMAQCFTDKTKQVVIGFSSIEPTKKFYNYFARCERLLWGMGYIGAAQKSKAYRGSRHNMAYTKDSYFNNKGFNHLNMNIGENDLFIQKITNSKNTVVNIAPEAQVKEFKFSSFGEMFDNDCFRSSTRKMYPRGIKQRINIELFSRTLFHAAMIALIATLIIELTKGNLHIPIYIGVAAMIILRLVAVLTTAAKASRRLGEKGLVLFFILHDIVSPLYGFRVWSRRTFIHNRNVWR
ncbi:MAG: hypothetical protein R3Y15_05665 [Rikenellaceae bacterium]